jgi:hypothetical protein
MWVDVYNSIPEDIKDQPTFNDFKNALHNCLIMHEFQEFFSK